MRHVLLALLAFFAIVPRETLAQENPPLGAVISALAHYRTTVGTTAALAIPSASVIAGLSGFRICNDGINTSTYLVVGLNADPTIDGDRLKPGACFECMNCTAGLLKSYSVAGQAASNGYSVIQFKQQ